MNYLATGNNTSKISKENGILNPKLIIYLN